MTRINVGVDPREIPKKALNAEHREIVRIPNDLRKGKYKNLSKAPKEFTLGEGHVLFFATRIGYLKRRYQAIYDACTKDILEQGVCHCNLYLRKEDENLLNLDV